MIIRNTLYYNNPTYDATLSPLLIIHYTNFGLAGYIFLTSINCACEELHHLEHNLKKIAVKLTLSYNEPVVTSMCLPSKTNLLARG